MPAEHFVPRFAKDLHASPRVQANALKALALANTPTPENDWRARAGAALMLGATWAGEDMKNGDVAEAIGVPAQAVAKHYAELAATLKKMQSI